jgi:hypothetical protein
MGGCGGGLFGGRFCRSQSIVLRVFLRMPVLRVVVMENLE